MKQNFKKYLKLGILLFGITFFSPSCQTDDSLKSNTQEQGVNQTDFFISKIGKSTINKNLRAHLTELNKNLKGQNSQIYQNRTIVSSEYGFSIDTDYATYIESADGTYHSYTFYMKREVETDTLENLLISLQPDGKYKALVITYNTTAQEKEDILNGLSVDLTDKVNSTEIDATEFISDIFSKSIYDCDGYIVVEWCSSGTHPDENGFAGCQPDYYNYDRIYFGCSSTGGGTDGGPGDEGDVSTGDGSTGTGGTGSGGTTTGNNNVTNPTGPCEGHNCPEELDPIHEANCEELNKFSTSSYSQNEFNELEGEINAGTEKGYFVKASANFPYFSTNPVESSDECNEIDVPINITSILFSIMHVHPTGCINGTHPMFGHGDLQNLYNISQNYNPTLQPELSSGPQLFAVYMTVANYHYAIKIKDVNQLQSIGAIFADVDDKIDFKKDLEEYYDDASDDTTPTQNQLTIAFLKFLKEKNLGVSLYRTAHDNLDFDPSIPQDERDAQWQQLVLNSQNTNFTTKDCN